MTRPFVGPDSIVRSIWGDTDTVLLVFAGSAAEFALNRAVDWLFFTGKLPADPLGRLFSTARYARDIVFADDAGARRTLERIRDAHQAVERSRGREIPAWAHRDVLYMLIDYSERAFGLLRRPLSCAEQAELYEVFRRVGEGLAIPDLPGSYRDWQEDRWLHLERDLARSDLTDALYAQYRRHLGRWRYEVLLGAQGVLVPAGVGRLLNLGRRRATLPALRGYQIAVRLGLRRPLQRLLMPGAVFHQVRQLDATGQESRVH